MAQPLIQGMAELDLGNGMTISFEARDATTGALVTGVVVTDVGIYGPNLSGAGGGASDFGAFMLVPGPGA